jgi:hypothetical protein
VLWLMFVAGVVLAFLMRRRKIGKLRAMTRSPLAGYDTGVRSPWRTPGRFFKPHRGF